MSRPDPGTVTRLLNEAGRGDAAAREQLYRFVYEEMLKLAKSRLGKEPRLKAKKVPESLVHEVYLRFAGKLKADWACRRQFYGYVRRAMWQICVELIRKDKRRVEEHPLSEWMTELKQDPIEIVGLDDTLNKLAEVYPRQAEVARMRFIEGRSVEESAVALGVSERTVEDDWAVARAWLYRKLKGGDTSMGIKEKNNDPGPRGTGPKAFFGGAEAQA